MSIPSLSIQLMESNLIWSFIRFIYHQRMLGPPTKLMGFMLLQSVLSSIPKTTIKAFQQKQLLLLIGFSIHFSTRKIITQLLPLFITVNSFKRLTPATVGFTKDQSQPHLVPKLSTGTSSRPCIQSKRSILISTETFNLPNNHHRTSKRLETSEKLKKLLMLICFNFLQLILRKKKKLVDGWLQQSYLLFSFSSSWLLPSCSLST